MNKIAKQTDRWMKIISTRPCCRLRTNLEPRIAFLGSWFGLYFGPCFGFHFWAPFWVPFWAPTITNKIQGPKTAPKNGTQNKDQNMTQIRHQNTIRGPKFVRRRKQGRVEMIFIQRSVCLAILFNCATNQQLQPKKEGKLGRAKFLKQRAWIPRRYPDWSPEMSGFLGARIRPRLSTPFCVYCAIGL